MKLAPKCERCGDRHFSYLCHGEAPKQRNGVQFKATAPAGKVKVAKFCERCALIDRQLLALEAEINWLKAVLHDRGDTLATAMRGAETGDG